MFESIQVSVISSVSLARILSRRGSAKAPLKHSPAVPTGGRLALFLLVSSVISIMPACWSCLRLFSIHLKVFATTSRIS